MAHRAATSSPRCQTLWGRPLARLGLSDLARQATDAEVSPVAAAAAGDSLRGFGSDVQRRLPPRPEPPGYSWCARVLQLLLIVSPILLSHPSPLPSQAHPPRSAVTAAAASCCCQLGDPAPSPLAAFLSGFPPEEAAAMSMAVACGAADGASATAAARDAAAFGGASRVLGSPGGGGTASGASAAALAQRCPRYGVRQPA